MSKIKEWQDWLVSWKNWNLLLEPVNRAWVLAWLWLWSINSGWLGCFLPRNDHFWRKFWCTIWNWCPIVFTQNWYSTTQVMLTYTKSFVTYIELVKLWFLKEINFQIVPYFLPALFIITEQWVWKLINLLYSSLFNVTTMSRSTEKPICVQKESILRSETPNVAFKKCLSILLKGYLTFPATKTCQLKSGIFANWMVESWKSLCM